MSPVETLFKVPAGFGPDVVFLAVCLPAMAIVAFISARAIGRMGPLEGRSVAIRANLIGLFVVMAAWRFALSPTAVLSSYGFPTPSDVRSPERLLEILRDQNRALVQTIEVFRYAIFTLLLFAGQVLYLIWPSHKPRTRRAARVESDPAGTVDPL